MEQHCLGGSQQGRGGGGVGVGRGLCPKAKAVSQGLLTEIVAYCSSQPTFSFKIF